MEKSWNTNQSQSNNAWRLLKRDHADWIATLKNHDEDVGSVIDSNKDEYYSSNVLGSFFEALSPSPVRHFSMGKDLTIIKKAVSSIVEAMEEDILTQNEANAVLEFLVTRFIERRFDSVMQRVFDVKSPKKYTFRGIRGAIK